MTVDSAGDKDRHRAAAWAEGVTALSVFVGMRACVAALEAIQKVDDAVLKHVLFVGLVVSYARAFEEARHAETQVSRKFSIRGVESGDFSRRYHDALLSLRNDRIAHAGHELNDYSLSFLRLKASIETPGADGTVIRQIKRHDVGTRARATLASGFKDAETTTALLAHFKALEAEAGGRLAVAIAKHQLASVLKLEQDARDGRDETKTLARASFRVPAGLLVMGGEDLVLSLAEPPAGLPLSFIALKLQLILSQQGGHIECSIYEVTDGQQRPESP